jgi:anti-sigma-K factor RskA
MNIRENETLRERLAAEYVLGTLRGGARRRFDGWLYNDAALRRTVSEWQERLMPMAEMPAPQVPPPQVWRDIERRLHLAAASVTGTAPASPGRWWDSLGWWRGLGLASSAVAALLAVAIGVRTLQTPSIDMVATLNDAQAQPALVVTADSRSQTMQVKVVGGAPVPDDKTLQLWAIPKQGNPRSLGVLGAGSSKLALDQRAIGSDVVLLAISLEPRGGSPDPNGPTGPVLYKGPWVRVL